MLGSCLSAALHQPAFPVLQAPAFLMSGFWGNNLNALPKERAALKPGGVPSLHPPSPTLLNTRDVSVHSPACREQAGAAARPALAGSPGAQVRAGYSPKFGASYRRRASAAACGQRLCQRGHASLTPTGFHPPGRALRLSGMHSPQSLLQEAGSTGRASPAPNRTGDKLLHSPAGPLLWEGSSPWQAEGGSRAHSTWERAGGGRAEIEASVKL